MSDANGFDYPLMARALILGDKDTVARKTREGLDLSMDPKDLIFRGLIPGMDVVGEKFRRNEYYVPQVLLSARAMYAGLDLLKPLITQTGSGSQSLGVVVIGTAQGDLHDIGKNLVAMMLEGAGFKVINLGRDVAPEKFVAAVKEHDAQIVGISALTASEPVAVWKDYLTYRLIEHFANVLPVAFVNERFAFYGTTLNGTPKIRDRWKRAIDSTNANLGEVVGKLYVAKYFPPSAKAKIEAMVKELLAAYHARISNLTWMSPQTKEKALAKLATLRVGVGYPDKWKDYSSLEIVRGDALGNIRRAEMSEYKRSLAKLHEPVDRGEWVMVPQEVNAVNLPLANALNFPAAILQAPYFDPKFDAAINYGAIGATIGHEISHSFDDTGAQFDAQGRLANWWTPEDLAHFQAAGAKLVAQFDAYAPFPDLHIHGKQTLSENIADVAGLSAAHDAYILSLNGKKAQVSQGLTGDQRFFLAYTQSWREKEREEALRQQVTTDGHAPAEYRGDTVRNLDAWYPAFNVKPGQKLYLAPGDRVQVW